MGKAHFNLTKCVDLQISIPPGQFCPPKLHFDVGTHALHMTYVILLESKGNCLKHHIKILYHMSHCHLGSTFQNSTTLSQTTVQLFGPSCFHPWSQFLLTSLLKMPLLPRIVSICFGPSGLMFSSTYTSNHSTPKKNLKKL